MLREYFGLGLRCVQQSCRDAAGGAEAEELRGNLIAPTRGKEIGGQKADNAKHSVNENLVCSSLLCTQRPYTHVSEWLKAC